MPVSKQSVDELHEKLRAAGQELPRRAGEHAATSTPRSRP